VGSRLSFFFGLSSVPVVPLGVVAVLCSCEGSLRLSNYGLLACFCVYHILHSLRVVLHCRTCSIGIARLLALLGVHLVVSPGLGLSCVVLGSCRFCSLGW
jgi:hypothetical protein